MQYGGCLTGSAVFCLDSCFLTRTERLLFHTVRAALEDGTQGTSLVGRSKSSTISGAGLCACRESLRLLTVSGCLSVRDGAVLIHQMDTAWRGVSEGASWGGPGVRLSADGQQD